MATSNGESGGASRGMFWYKIARPKPNNLTSASPVFVPDSDSDAGDSDITPDLISSAKLTPTPAAPLMSFPTPETPPTSLASTSRNRRRTLSDSSVEILAGPPTPCHPSLVASTSRLSLGMTTPEAPPEKPVAKRRRFSHVAIPPTPRRSVKKKGAASQTLSKDSCSKHGDADDERLRLRKLAQDLTLLATRESSFLYRSGGIADPDVDSLPNFAITDFILVDGQGHIASLHDVPNFENDKFAARGYHLVGKVSPISDLGLAPLCATTAVVQGLQAPPEGQHKLTGRLVVTGSLVCRQLDPFPSQSSALTRGIGLLVKSSRAWYHLDQPHPCYLGTFKGIREAAELAAITVDELWHRHDLSTQTFLELLRTRYADQFSATAFSMNKIVVAETVLQKFAPGWLNEERANVPELLKASTLANDLLTCLPSIQRGLMIKTRPEEKVDLFIPTFRNPRLTRILRLAFGIPDADDTNDRERVLEYLARRRQRADGKRREPYHNRGCRATGVGPILSTYTVHGVERSYYNAVRLDTEVVRLGDAVAVATSDELGTARWIGRVEALYSFTTDRSKSFKFHLRWYNFPSTTAIGRAGWLSANELFATTLCDDEAVETFIEKVKITHLPDLQKPENHAAADGYFCRATSAGFTLTALDAELFRAPNTSEYTYTAAGTPRLYRLAGGDLPPVFAATCDCCRVRQSDRFDRAEDRTYLVEWQRDGKGRVVPDPGICVDDLGVLHVNDTVYVDLKKLAWKVPRAYYDPKLLHPARIVQIDGLEEAEHVVGLDPRDSSSYDAPPPDFVTVQLFVRGDLVGSDKPWPWARSEHHLVIPDRQGDITASRSSLLKVPLALIATTIVGRCRVQYDALHPFSGSEIERLTKYELEAGPDDWFVTHEIRGHRLVAVDAPPDGACERCCTEQRQTDGVMARLEREPIRVLDVFAGAGGLSQGIEGVRAGPEGGSKTNAFKISAAIEMANPAASTYRDNFALEGASVLNSTTNEVLQQLEAGERPPDFPERGEIDVVVGGPSCQCFSGANRHRRVDDPRQLLFAHQLALAEHLEAPFLVIENVVGLMGHPILAAEETSESGWATLRGGINNGMLELVMVCLLEAGYQFRISIVNAGQHGAPQARDRLVILAARPGHTLPVHPQPNHLARSPADMALSADLLDVPGLSRCDSRIGAGDGYDKSSHIVRKPLRPSLTLLDALSDLPSFDVRPPTLPPQSGGAKRHRFDKALLGIVLSGEQIGHADKTSYALSAAETSTYARRMRRLGSEVKRHTVPRLSEANLEKLWTLPPGDAHFRLRETSGWSGRLGWDEQCSTVLTKFAFFNTALIHPEDYRPLSIREVSRVQGFDDDFVAHGDEEAAWRQIGNAVPPPLGTAIGRELLNAIVQDRSPVG